jgi:hypothetical protein
MKWTFERTKAGYARMWATAKVKVGADYSNATRFATKITKGR